MKKSSEQRIVRISKISPAFFYFEDLKENFISLTRILGHFGFSLQVWKFFHSRSKIGTHFPIEILDLEVGYE